MRPPLESEFFPLAEASTDDESPLESSPLAEVPMEARTKHVLLVEDEEAHAELIQLSFEVRDDVRLAVATSLEEARGHLAQSTPDLLIIDSLLPDGRGIELLEARSPESSYPAILLTSHADKAMQAEAMAAGATRYVVKSEVTLLEMPQIADSAFREAGTDR